MKKNQLEASEYLRDDRLAIQCAVTVVKETRVSEARTVPEIEVPPSDLVADMGRLLDQGDGADITFEVRGRASRHTGRCSRRARWFSGPSSMGR
jgi:speckle-type POZ protein